MKRRTFIRGVATVIPALAAIEAPGMKTGNAPEPINLPEPDTEGGRSVLSALKDRRTVRRISPKPLPLPLLSGLLWAAFGVNRPGVRVLRKPGRTAPSASNSQEIDLYVCLEQGVYVYEAGSHRLMPVVAGDFRSRAGRGDASRAPLNIFYVVDLTRYETGPWQPDPHITEPEVQKSYYYTATGFIAQNVFLFASANGLAAWFHNCDRKNPLSEFKLKSTQRVLFAQTVGYPA